ncbi:hypothetical protein pb186bvf_008596 [Paramecium bursaria]
MKVKNHGYDVEHLNIMVYKVIAQFLLGETKHMILKIINKKTKKGFQTIYLVQSIMTM